MNASPVEASRDQLVEDFMKVVADAEALLHATADQGGDELAALRASMEDSLAAARLRLRDTRDTVIRNAYSAAHATDSYVHQNPWSAIGVAAGLGLLAGLLGGRR